MAKVPTWAELMYSTRVITQTKNDMLRKNMFLPHTKQYLTDPNMLKAAIYNYAVEPMKIYSCPVCGISIKCPKQWAINHTKTHNENKKDRKENEIIESKLNPYFN